MAPRQELRFNILAEDNASRGFLAAGRAASAASDDVMGLARRLDELQGKRAQARVDLAGNKEALAQLDVLDRKLIATGRKVTPDITVEGAAKASLEITGLDVQLDHLSEKAGKSGAAGAVADLGKSAGGAAGPLAGLAGGPMAAMVGAGVALSPIIATVGLGTAGFGLAAAGAIAPVFKAAQATGGLKANLAKLDPEQRKVAGGLLDLGKQYHAFEQALQPTVLRDFGGALRIAGHLMHDLQPVSQATGKAIGGLLGAVDKEFQSGTWTRFFGFMGATAGPDIKLVSSNLTDLMHVLPPLLEAMQPVAKATLILTDDLLKLAAASNKAFDGLTSVDKQAADTPKNAGLASQAFHLWEQGVRGFEDVTKNLVTFIFPNLEPGIKHVASATAQAGQAMHGTGINADALAKSLANAGPATRQAASAANALDDMSSKASGGLRGVGAAASASKQPVLTLAQSVTALTTAMAKNVGEVLTLQGDEVQWRQSLQAATAQLRSNSAGLEGNSKNALANKAAVLQATQNVMTFADDQLTLGGNLNAASRRIQEQIHWLQVHGGKSKFARDEIHALRLEEDKLRATIRQRLIVSGTGTWHIAHGLGARGTGVTAAAGALVTVGTTPTADDVLARVSKGEAIVPAHLVPPLAPFLKANKVPGFAAGGFAGSVPGLGKWLASEDSSTLRALEAAVAGAVKGALAGMGGFGSGGGALGGDPGANQALARRMYPPWGSGAQWAAWNLLNMAESGWNRFAKNPMSGAYGIPQALPPTKMPWAAQEGGGSHAGPQIGWQLGYISSTYRDPVGAWAHERAFHWYDSGVQFLPPGPSIAWNGTGRPERVGGEDLGPLLREIRDLLRRAPAETGAATASGTMRALNGLSARIPAPRARGR